MVFLLGCGQEKAAAPSESESTESSETKEMSSGQTFEDGFYFADEGHVDSISGVTIHVIEFFSLVEEALKKAK
ncbi:MAG: hypothetical protein ACOC7X_07780 [Spirochaetota bacterium]